MVESLPRAVGLKLEQALGQWRHWRCDPVLPGAPHIEQVLPQGLSNWSVIAAVAGRRFVVRIDGVNPAANGINRQHEWRTLQAAGVAGIAPVARYFNPELGALVCDYLPPDDEPRESLADVACLLRCIHQLPTGHQRLDLAQRLNLYDHWVARDNAAGLALLQQHQSAVVRKLALCSAYTVKEVLCHNDLLHPNRLYSRGRLYALDWEYAATCSPWHDLGAVYFGDGLEEAQGAELIQHYLSRPATREEVELLHCHSAVYGYLELAWYLAQKRHVVDEVTMHRCSDRLSQLLQ